jgi:hypothetical protein
MAKASKVNNYGNHQVEPPTRVDCSNMKRMMNLHRCTTPGVVTANDRYEQALNGFKNSNSLRVG